MENHTIEIKNYAKEIGVNAVGIADLVLIRGIKTFPENLLDSYSFGISIGVKLSDKVIDEIVDRPTPNYAKEYKNANKLLDSTSAQISNFIQHKGFKAQNIKASHVADWGDYLGNISHRAVARASGVGWIGKSLMLIHPEYGPRIRLATILTDMPLIPDEPIKNRCGKCIECVKVCPADGIKGVSTQDYYREREDALHLSKCMEKLRNDFMKIPQIENMICGVCIMICPFGRKKIKS